MCTLKLFVTAHLVFVVPKRMFPIWDGNIWSGKLVLASETTGAILDLDGRSRLDFIGQIIDRKAAPQLPKAGICEIFEFGPSFNDLRYREVPAATLAFS